VEKVNAKKIDLTPIRFEGDWDRTYDPLRELLRALKKLQMNKEEL
jgi:hypothetical protein